MLMSHPSDRTAVSLLLKDWNWSWLVTDTWDIPKACHTWSKKAVRRQREPSQDLLQTPTPLDNHPKGQIICEPSAQSHTCCGVLWSSYLVTFLPPQNWKRLCRCHFRSLCDPGMKEGRTSNPLQQCRLTITLITIYLNLELYSKLPVALTGQPLATKTTLSREAEFTQNSRVFKQADIDGFCRSAQKLHSCCWSMATTHEH